MCTVRARSCVLACYNMMIPVSLPGTARAAEGGAALCRQNPADLCERGAEELAAVQDARDRPGLFARLVFFIALPQPNGRYRRAIAALARPTSRCWCKWCERRFNRVCRSASSIAPAILTFSAPASRRSSTTFATSWGVSWAPEDLTPIRDIAAITVNRWPHGYAYEYNPLFDPDWPAGSAPHEIGRAPFGRITIANSDAGAAAYTDCAIDQAYRAVQELFRT